MMIGVHPILEEQFGASEVPFLDLRDGVVFRPLHDVIDEYNEGENIQAAFSIERIQDYFPGAVDLIRHQQNSGMLGVPGNIGFSTTLHGFIAAKILGPSYCVCVGDDAAGLAEDIDPIIWAIQRLGSIERSKFSIVVPTYGQEQFSRFLKRRLTYSDDGMSLSELFNLPIPVFFSGKIPEYRSSPPNFSFLDRVEAISATISSLYWDGGFQQALFDPEFRLALGTYFKEGYRHLGIPMVGRLPGAFITEPGGKSHQITFCIPPVRFPEYAPNQYQDWLDLLFMSRPQRYFMVPMNLSKERINIPFFSKDQEFLCLNNRLSGVLRDLEYIRLAPFVELTDEFSEENWRRLKLQIRGIENIVWVAQALKDAPEWLHSFSGVPVDPTMSSTCIEHI
jgi:hypothetical protein